MHLNVWVFLSGNQGFIRATKLMALVAEHFEIGTTWIFFFHFEHCNVEETNDAMPIRNSFAIVLKL